jgi:competence ComEA-like helix-hairpin-helix protein
MNRDARYAALLVLAAALFLISLAGGHGIPGMPDRHAMPDSTPVAAGEFFPGFPIDLNTATREDLMILPGIGEKTADRVLQLRAESGGFDDVSDLLRVKWLGPAKLENLRNLVAVKPVPDNGAAGSKAGNEEIGKNSNF